MDGCKHFECENLKDDVCRFDDEVVENACVLCNLNDRCDRCKHKGHCTINRTECK